MITDPKRNRDYAVDPSGHLVLVPHGIALKPGWRYATQDDIDASLKLERDRAAKEKAEADAAAAAAAKADEPPPISAGGPFAPPVARRPKR